MPVTQRMIAINDFGLARRERTSASGKTSNRYTVSIEAEPLVHTFDTKRLGRAPALAIAEHLKERIKAIGAVAAPSTQLERKYAATALNAGKAWANKRYAGGRIGTMAPNQSHRLFNDSGRFVAGIVAAPTRDENWVINVPANRLDPRTFRDGEAGVVRMVALLREYVPEFGDATKLIRVPEVRRAIIDSLDTVLARGDRAYQRNTKLRAALRQSQLEALKQGLELFQTIGGI